MKSFKQHLLETNLERRIFHEKPDVMGGMNTPIYNQITNRANVVPFNNNDEFKSRKQEYQTLKASSLPTEDDGAWHYHFANKSQISTTRRASVPKQTGYTFKRFYSVDGTENPEVMRKFAAAIPDLHSRLDAVGQHLGQGFSFKIPSDPHTLANHTDSIVIHHYDMPNSSLSKSIHATVQKWAGDNGIQFLDRQGTDVGVDHDQHGSFSQQLATRINNGSTGSLSQIGTDIVDKAVQHIDSIRR